ncbi:hypothetical protein [Halobellus captivus]|uniref:hypothetical protein n=1 Tax=Halobellus captivus TaxID=2592614 RepID=UPI0011A090E4|nr:hypothetical protein [Halobellus captivus]
MVARKPVKADHPPRRARETGTEEQPATADNTLSTYLEILLSGVIVTVGFVVAFPTLIDVTNALGILSTTALVFLFIFAWYGVWAGIRVGYPWLRRSVVTVYR